MIIYRNLISEKFKDWTASEKIVYSYLLNKAIMTEGGFQVTENGESHLLKDDICANSWLSIENISMAKVCSETGISRRNITYTYRNLESKNVLGEKGVFVIDSITDKGYIKILEGYKLRLEHLVFFSWYKNYVREKSGRDCTSLEKLASFYGTDFKGISHLMSALSAKKLLKRVREKNVYFTEIIEVKEKDINDIAKGDFQYVDTLNLREISRKQRKISVPKESKSKTYLMIDIANGFVKIGKSKNPKFRERTLQSEKPTIELYAVKDKDIEKQLHSLYADRNVRGEWYNLSQKEINSIIKDYGFAMI